MADSPTDLPGLLSHLRKPGGGVPVEELRLATVLNGGVSLAVWMGGATLEIDRLVKADPDDDTSPYAAMLKLTGCTARTDVISGTSAGGINGAALALAQANPSADLSTMRDVWSDQGDFEKLLRRPFQGTPTSLLRGDDYFLPQLGAALHRLAAPAGPSTDAPLDLTITATVLRGNQSVTVDAMGQELPQTLHAARFVWSRGDADDALSASERDRDQADPFARTNLEATSAQLALAARCTASFPVAFEPAFVPVGAGGDTLRPDMSDVVRDWGDVTPGVDRSRYVVDGGLLANTPTRPALEAIASMPATGPVRRVVLLVYPHAGAPDAVPADTTDRPPSLSRTVFGLLDALSSTGNRTFVEEIERHNRLAAGRHGTRAELLADHPGPAAIQALASCTFPEYLRLADSRIADHLSGRAIDRRGGGTQRWAERWNVERIRHTVAAAQEASGGRPRAGTVDGPPTEAAHGTGHGWAWGPQTATDIVDAVADLLRRLSFVMPTSQAALDQARSEMTTFYQTIRAARQRFDADWEAGPVATTLPPSQRVWELWLAVYDLRMTTDSTDESAVSVIRARLRDLIDVIVADQAAQTGDEGALGLAGATLACLREDVTTWLAAVSVGDLGEQIHGAVLGAVGRLPGLLPALSEATRARKCALDQDLRGWAALLTPEEHPTEQQLLTRLLQLAMVHAVVGNEAVVEISQPVELVQISAHTKNALSEYSISAQDKLGGWSVHRFGGFLKRSWRVNDWIWGRLDAATMLSRTVLHPRHIRRAAVLSGYLSLEADPQDRADQTLAEVLRLLPPGAAQDPRLVHCRSKAAVELRGVLNPQVPVGDLPASLPGLADLFAAALHLDIVPDELPALGVAIGADRLAGANPRSNGERFLLEHPHLLNRRRSGPTRAPGESLPTGEGLAAFRAFDRAGIGREPLPEELSSDLMLRVATTAAAVGVTVVDSPASGLGLLRGVTRTLRGIALVPYWGIQALTSRSQLARALALLALSVGGALLALSLLGVLPTALSGAGTALGLGAVLGAVAFGALRTGTLLHSLVLVTPLFALVGYAATRIREVVLTQDSANGWGLTALGVVIALCLGLLLLGSLPSPAGSVSAALDRLALRFGVQPSVAYSTQDREPGPSHLLRWVRGLLICGWRAAPTIALVVAGLGLGVTATLAADSIRDHIWVLWTWQYAVFLALVAAIGGRLAVQRGHALQVLRAPREGLSWSYGPTHCAGAAAGWSVLYGVAYLAIAAVLALSPAELLEASWAAALFVGVVLLGLWLVLVAPWLSPRRAVRRIIAREVGEARRNPAVVDSVGDDSPAERYAVHLVATGIGLRCWTTPHSGDHPGAPLLTRQGAKVFDLVCQAAGDRSLGRPRPRQSRGGGGLTAEDHPRARDAVAPTGFEPALPP